MEPLILVQDLGIAFGGGAHLTRATTDVSFSVNRGEILSLVGESGSGKSVTALSILGLLPRQGRVTGGKVLYGGQNLMSLTDTELDAVRGREIAMIFQDIMYSLNPVLTIGAQMTEGMIKHLKLSKQDALRRAAELLQRTGIRDPNETLRKYPHMLSGGMRQRVMIAMALSCEPKLLIADEPTTALDVTIQLEIIRLLMRLRDETGMAILLITHDIGVVAETADRVVVMYAGQCVEEGPVKELLSRPAHPYTRALMRAVPGIDMSREERLVSIPGSVPENYGDMPGCRFAPRCPQADGCLGANHPVWHEVGPEHRSLCSVGREALGYV